MIRRIVIVAACLAGASSAIAANLIVNGDFEAGNTNFLTDYVYAPANVTPEGTYTVTNNPLSVHPSPPFVGMGDHTTGAGLMMIVNGWVNEPGKTVWKQTVNVQSNDSYVFSAWAASVFAANPSTFYFYVNGTQHQPVVQLPSQTAIWQNYSTIWSNGVLTNAVLEVRLFSTAQYGNDFALDDIAFRRLSETNYTDLLIATAVELYWKSETGQLYQVQWSPDLLTNLWFDMGPPVLGNGSTNSYFDSTRGRSQRFYRALPVD